jgi:serine/threonine protein kinase
LCAELHLLWCRSLAAFDIRAKLYAGHISSVYRAVDRKSGITVGLKLYRRTMLNDMERHQIAREIWLHIQLNHPSIIALYAAWKDKDYIYLVLEWAPEVGCGLLPDLCCLVARSDTIVCCAIACVMSWRLCTSG